MTISDRRGLKQAARQAIAQATYDPKKLILIHTGASAVLSLVLALFLAMPAFSASAEKNTGVVRVLLTKLNLTDQIEVSLDGSYTLNGISFQRGSDLTISCASGSIFVYYEGMALNAGKELTLLRHQSEAGKENGYA